MNLTTRTDVAPALATYYDRVLLQRGMPYLVHGRFAQQKNLPAKSGTTVKWRRYSPLPTATTPLVEGVTPSGNMMAFTEVFGTPLQYGSFIHYSDLVDLQNQDPVLTEASELLGRQAGETLDELCRDAMHAGSNVYYAGNVASRNLVNEVPKASYFNTIREIMIGNNAQTMRGPMRAVNKVGTVPGGPAYWAICSHELETDIRKMDGFLPASQYSEPSKYEEEIGMLPDAKVRFLITQKGKSYADSGGTTGAGTTYRSTSGSQVDVYTVLVIAENAYGEVKVSGMSLKSIIKKLGSSGSADPLDQRGSAGWKTMYTAKILNDLWLMRCEFACSSQA